MLNFTLEERIKPDEEILIKRNKEYFKLVDKIILKYLIENTFVSILNNYKVQFQSAKITFQSAKFAL